MKLFCSLLFLLTPCLLYSQATAPKYSNEFLSIGIGARGLGMAKAQTAIACDVTAGYWNPAGLPDIPTRYEVSLMHAEYFAGIVKYDYAGFATPIDSVSHLAVSAIRFGVDDIPDTRFLFDASGAINYNNITLFSAADYAFLVSYARKIRKLPGLQAGANVKIIHRNVGSFANAWGFGFDAGLLYKHRNWRFGLMARDVTSTFNAWSINTSLLQTVYNQTNNRLTANSIEITLPKLSAGVARIFRFRESFSLLAAADADFTFDGRRNVLIRSEAVSVDPRIGLEAGYRNVAFLRLGAGEVQRIKNFDSSTYTVFQPNFGLGFRLGKFGIDYALTDIGDRSQSPYSHVFSLKAGF